MEGDLGSMVAWNDDSCHLKDFTKRHSLPCLALVRRGSYRGVINPEQVVYVYHVETGQKVLAEPARQGSRNRGDMKYSLPITYAGWFELLSEDGKQIQPIQSVEELSQSSAQQFIVRESFKAPVSAAKAENFSTDQQRQVRIGERLTLRGEVEVAFQGNRGGIAKKRYLRCNDDNGDNVFLGLDLKAQFSPIAGSMNISGVHSLKGLLQNFRLPIVVKLVYGTIPARAERNFSPVFRLIGAYKDETAFLLPLPARRESKMVAVSTREHLFLSGAKNMDAIRERREFQEFKNRCDTFLRSYQNSFHIVVNLPDVTVISRGKESRIEELRSGEAANPDSSEDEQLLFEEIEEIYRYVREGGDPPQPKTRPTSTATEGSNPARNSSNVRPSKKNTESQEAVMDITRTGGMTAAHDNSLTVDDALWEEQIYEEIGKIRSRKLLEKSSRSESPLTSPVTKSELEHKLPPATNTAAVATAAATAMPTAATAMTTAALAKATAVAAATPMAPAATAKATAVAAAAPMAPAATAKATTATAVATTTFAQAESSAVERRTKTDLPETNGMVISLRQVYTRSQGPTQPLSARIDSVYHKPEVQSLEHDSDSTLEVTPPVPPKLFDSEAPTTTLIPRPSLRVEAPKVTQSNPLPAPAQIQAQSIPLPAPAQIQTQSNPLPAPAQIQKALPKSPPPKVLPKTRPKIPDLNPISAKFSSNPLGIGTPVSGKADNLLERVKDQPKLVGTQLASDLPRTKITDLTTSITNDNRPVSSSVDLLAKTRSSFVDKPISGPVAMTMVAAKIPSPDTTNQSQAKSVLAPVIPLLPHSHVEDRASDNFQNFRPFNFDSTMMSSSNSSKGISDLKDTVPPVLQSTHVNPPRPEQSVFDVSIKHGSINDPVLKHEQPSSPAPSKYEVRSSIPMKNEAITTTTTAHSNDQETTNINPPHQLHLRIGSTDQVLPEPVSTHRILSGQNDSIATTHHPDNTPSSSRSIAINQNNTSRVNWTSNSSSGSSIQVGMDSGGLGGGGVGGGGGGGVNSSTNSTGVTTIHVSGVSNPDSRFFPQPGGVGNTQVYVRFPSASSGQTLYRPQEPGSAAFRLQSGTVYLTNS